MRCVARRIADGIPRLRRITLELLSQRPTPSDVKSLITSELQSKGAFEMNYIPHLLLSISRQTSAEVFHAHHWGISWGFDLIEELKEVANRSEQSRARLCMHPSLNDRHQEMLIVMAKTAIELPQRRTTGFDTKIVLEGQAVLRYYATENVVTRSVILGGPHARYVHTQSDEFHSLLVASDWFVFLEVLKGPFDSNTTEIAPWILKQ